MTMRIIPAIDLMGGQVVRLYKGDPSRRTVYSDDPVSVARQWEREGADMLHIVDLDATLGTVSKPGEGEQKRQQPAGDTTTTTAAASAADPDAPAPVRNTGAIKRILDAVSIPVEVAGGLRSRSSVLDMAKVADKVVIGTLAFEDRPLLSELLSELGSERIVISVDHKNGMIVTRGWQTDTGVPLADAITGFARMGITEFLLTDVSRDGTLEGPDLESLAKACRMRPDGPAGPSDINVIASGGISDVRDIRPVMERGAYGVILGKALYEGMVSIRGARDVAMSATSSSSTTTTTKTAASATTPS